MLRRSFVPALVVLLASLISAPVANAVAIKHVTAPLDVFLGAGDVIESELVAVRAKFFSKPEQHILVVSLLERRQSGADVFLGEQAIPLTAANVVLEDGGDGRPVVEVAWSTSQILGGSVIDACATVLKLTNHGDKVVGDEECRTYDPSL